MRKVYTLTALALACAASVMLNAACKAGDGAEVAGASSTAQNASTQNAATQNAATPHPTSTPGDNVRRISVTDTQQMIEKGTALVVDVRPKAQYDQSHIKGSVSLPREELKNPARLAELPKDKLIIFYCA